ncbi:L-2-amino-thiazoline-4-carboxylic acid hydrolase [Butyrivibrio sp. FC2001]|uniref:L-2-amino-thiazoline-4-carboxylic acid hydrolase n=1 Tax=Butyrivibrio sp. FC2001 TaxID=1280671 RepID=UPI000420A446|nr:L-2-amino-thiazoline-4-carboxylic acid hydrolase [Butyrivibrio sp. FC2001]
MKYSGMPVVMWFLYRKSFQMALVNDLKKSHEEAKQIMAKAKPKYREIIGKLPEFEKGDRFKANIINCAILISVFLGINRKPTVTEATRYYEHAMTNFVTKAFCKMGGKQKFTDKDIEGMKQTAALNAADRNPYSWNMEYLPYEDGSGYEARFSKCGICTLMKEYGMFELVQAMCHLDYTMSEFGGATIFVREYTLASGGPYCDCGYKKKN